jgi:hypothetical protein
MTMTPAPRKFALVVHVASSVGWFGAAAAYIALDVAAAASQDVQLMRAAYLAMELVARGAAAAIARVPHDLQPE